MSRTTETFARVKFNVQLEDADWDLTDCSSAL